MHDRRAGLEASGTRGGAAVALPVTPSLVLALPASACAPAPERELPGARVVP